MKHFVFQNSPPAPGMGEPRKHGRIMSSAEQPALIGRVSQAKLKCEVKRGLMNQTACSRSRPVPIAMHRSMVVPPRVHLGILGSWVADSSEIGAPTLGNDDQHDSGPFEIRFYNQICRI